MYDFNNFVEELEYVISNADTYEDIINSSSTSMQKLLNNPNLITDEDINGILEGTTKSKVYQSNNNNFIVQIFVWEEGCCTPVHDHETWGIMGIYKNKLFVNEFALTQMDNPGSYDINEINSFTAPEGGVCYVLPPDNEIHKVSNPTSDISVSIHVYGKDITEYNIYDLKEQKIIRHFV